MAAIYIHYGGRIDLEYFHYSLRPIFRHSDSERISGVGKMRE